MAKTIENLKKFLHIGGSTKKNGTIGHADTTTIVQHQTVTTTVEITDNGNNNTNGEAKIPLAVDDMDEDEYDETAMRCGGCRKVMKNGHEITLSSGQTFHYSCFHCEVCGVDVSKNQKYAHQGGLLLCEPCIRAAVRTSCHKCILTIEMNDTKLIVDGKNFHQKCFACSNCSSQLDSVYGCKDGEYFCQPCYVEKCGKKCEGCQKIILGAGLKFGDQSYHKDCFKCCKCGEDLKSGSAHRFKNQPLCGGCYDKQFLELCHICKETAAEGIMFRDAKYHKECFKCTSCNILLADKKGEFLMTDKGLKCKNCIKKEMQDDLKADSVAEMCKGCELPIHVKNLVFDGESSWHSKCFVCCQCNGSLINSKYYEKQQKLFCNNCFHSEHLPTCYNCKVEIVGAGGVKMHSESGQTLTWHQECLQCSVCAVKVQLGNVVFNEKLFCKSCYIETKLNKCDKCLQVITGAGYAFRDKFWHDTCFGCDHCDNIFQDGKFRNLRNEKLCDNCFKNKTSS